MFCSCDRRYTAGKKILEKSGVLPEPKNLTVVRVIGKGGFGETVLVKDSVTNKDYIRKESVSSNEANMRYQFDMLLHLQREKICREHFICPVIKYRENGRYFILFDFLRGYQTLDKIQKKVPRVDRVIMSKQLVALVQLLHRHKIVHGDIKSNNIMVNRSNLKTRLIDFGVAIIDDGSAKFKSKRGFNRYVVAPGFRINQPQSFDAFKKNDMWALGNVVSYAIYGVYPNLNTKTLRTKMNDTLNKELGTSLIYFDETIA